ncbi:EF-hand domain-containing protein D1 [Camelus dromedarius]|uniref:EF-hand domain-containing protein D1 n=1 Tax=Camelus dromedarius TaxID=9838 RepID=A0A5N4E600_CAMDR|nr:EF-hand domain-containing protein D1 [Camelus dromedarius]
MYGTGLLQPVKMLASYQKKKDICQNCVPTVLAAQVRLVFTCIQCHSHLIALPASVPSEDYCVPLNCLSLLTPFSITTPLKIHPAHYDSGRDGFIDLMELKLMMEKLGAPQTHLGLKSMIKEVDEDFDGKLSFREFLLIFHKAAAGELQEDSGLMALAKLSEIDVALEGVKGAKDFFEAKVQALSSASKFEAELKAEQDERKRVEEKRRLRQAAFRELKAAFST